MHRGYSNPLSKGSGSTPVKKGLSVQELKQMTALRMAHTQESWTRPSAPHSVEIPVRNDLTFSTVQPPRYAPSTLDLHHRPEVRLESRSAYPEDTRVEPSFLMNVIPVRNYPPIIPTSTPVKNLPPPIMQSVPVLSTSPSVVVSSPDANGIVPHALTVQELKELTRRRLIREGVPTDGRGLHGSYPHPHSHHTSREGSVCSADDVNLSADGDNLFDRSSISGASGNTDLDAESYPDYMVPPIPIAPFGVGGGNLLHQGLGQSNPAIYPPLSMSSMSRQHNHNELLSNGGILHNHETLSFPIGSNHSSNGEVLGNGSGQLRYLTRDREMDPASSSSSSQSFNPDGLHNDETHGGVGGSRSPPPSPRSLRSRPKLAVSYPDPMRQRSVSTDASTIPYETAESVLLTPTPRSPATPKLSRQLSTDRREMFEFDFTLGRVSGGGSGSGGLSTLEQPMGLVHGLSNLKHEELSEDGWPLQNQRGRYGPPNFLLDPSSSNDTACSSSSSVVSEAGSSVTSVSSMSSSNKFMGTKAGLTSRLVSHSSSSRRNSLDNSTINPPIGLSTGMMMENNTIPVYSNHHSSNHNNGNSNYDLDAELEALALVTTTTVDGVEPSPKSKSFSPIFLSSESNGLFTYSPENSPHECELQMEKDLGALLAADAYHSDLNHDLNLNNSNSNSNINHHDNGHVHVQGNSFSSASSSRLGKTYANVNVNSTDGRSRLFP
eukprot:gene2267-4415_t